MIRLSWSVKLLCSLGRGTALAAAASTPSGPAPPPSARSRARLLARSSNRTFASLILASRTSRRRSSSGSSSPRASSPYSASSASSISAEPAQQLRYLRFQPGLRLLYPLIAHGLVLGGVGLVFAPIQGEVSHLHQTCLPAHPRTWMNRPAKTSRWFLHRTRCGSPGIGLHTAPGRPRPSHKPPLFSWNCRRAVAVQQIEAIPDGMPGDSSTERRQLDTTNREKGASCPGYVLRGSPRLPGQGQMTLRESLTRRLRQQIGLFQSIRSVLFGHLTPPTCCLLV